MKNIWLCFLLLPVFARAQIITTMAGNGMFDYGGDKYHALSAELNYPTGIAIDGSGALYIADSKNNRIRRISGAGVITTIAGMGIASYSGDGGPATAAGLNYPTGIAVDKQGNIFIADTWNNIIRCINNSGIITTIAGTGAIGDKGDGSAATAAEMYYPSGIAVDEHGSVFVADVYNERVRKIDNAGIISTIAGTGNYGYNGDGAATQSELASPVGIAVDASGNVYIADEGNSRIRKIDAEGIIHTIAGTGISGYSGDGGLAGAAEIYDPYGLVLDNSGNIYFSEQGNSRIRGISSSGIISTIAGNGVAGFSGDGGPAAAAEMQDPYGVALDSAGNIYFADENNSRIRKVCRKCTEGSVAPYFLIYPVPCRNELTILSSLPIKSIEIFDTWGQMMCNYVCNTQDMNIDVTWYAAAMYFIRINGAYALKFVKE